MRNKRLYNFLVNTYGLSKDKVMDHLNHRIGDLEIKVNNQAKGLIHDYIRSTRFHNFMKNKVASILENGFSPDHWRSERDMLEKFIKKRVRESIKEEVDRQLKEKYSLELTKKEDE